ncbi:transcription factor FER-LIKE IRON DEFICIENCY-INDUCED TRANSCRIPTION FACTOR [Citrus sinensis]|uniref:Transcription factor FER-LIKE IRON DEFICIENCY-INDUCED TRANSCRIPTION FACTOR n=1 Tax=Citrus sinensis TaxID=2711 RepID=A0ACB8ITU8_CITSI|nr:transcription factor FER-LIKE IRON DEFICIENCY-INDUCED TRANSCRIPTION FACTOR [Citrus sinensis]
MDEFGNPLTLHAFIDDPNFDQFIDLIRGENEDPLASFDCDLINGCFADTQFIGSAQDDVFGHFNGTAAGTMVSDDLTFVLNSSFPDLDGDMKGEHREEENNGDDSSGATRTATTASTRNKKADRSRTLVSERKRRGKMKEKLYGLRALVPNISKMDKASIIGDAVSYLQELQMQVRKLKAEIASLEYSMAGSEKNQEPIQKPKKTQVLSGNLQPICKKIMQIDVFQVEERRFYLRLVSSGGQGVAVSLYKALESLTSFDVQNFNFATEPERLVGKRKFNMDTEELIRKCKAITLKGGEEGKVSFKSGMKSKEEKTVAGCLVGEVLTNKNVNKEGLKLAMQQAWQTIREVKVDTMGENMFMFRFATEADKRRAIAGNVHVQDCLRGQNINFEKFDGKINFSTWRREVMDALIKINLVVALISLVVPGMRNQAH